MSRAVFRRELGAYFLSPVAWVVLAVYLVLAGYFFSVYMVLAREADMRGVLSNMALLFLFMAPALTSRLWAEEARAGTDELLLTSPAGTARVVLGKYFAVLAVFGLFLLFTGLFPVLMARYGPLDWRATLTGYLGLLLLGAAALAAGLFASSLSDSQVVSAVLAFGLLLGFWVAGWIGEELPGAAGRTLAYVALVPHYEDFARGVVASQDVVYFLSLASGFLFLAVRRLESARWR